jgi:hypothetical protein
LVSPVPAPFTVATADLVQRCHGAGATVTVRLLRIAGVKLLAEQLHEEKEKPTGGGDTHPLVRPGDPPSVGYTAARCPQSHTAHACEKRSAFGSGVEGANSKRRPRELVTLRLNAGYRRFANSRGMDALTVYSKSAPNFGRRESLTVFIFHPMRQDLIQYVLL